MIQLLTVFAPIFTGAGRLHQNQHTRRPVLRFDVDLRNVEGHLELQRIDVGSVTGQQNK